MFSFLSLGYTITDMDKEQIVFLAGVTLCALSIGAFIFWGPNPKPRRRGALIGLQNLGLTCFLNTLLQAMASCPIFIEWLESCHDQGRVASTLYYLLKVLSSERSKLPPSVEDPLAPSALIVALQRHGWTMGSGEQDAHELFHLLMVSLEEEAHKAIAAEKGLSDALEPRTVHRRRSLPSCSTGDLGDGPVKANCVESNHVVNQPSGDAHSLPPLSKLVNKHGELITRQVVPKYDCNQNYQTSPFCGLLTSQLQCVTCGFKSVLRFDKFDSLSLHLPDKRQSRHTLSQLLDDFTHTEAVTGVACEGCNKGLDSSLPPVTATSLKTLTIGKLPRCLCIHIHRMSMAFGTPYKRSDDIDFPEFLIMDPYTHNAMMKEQKLKEASKSTREDPQESQTLPSFLPCRTEGWNHIYRLKAVVVHCGSVESGHFVTYRRGPLQSNTRHRSDRWYFTSDETVRDTTLAEAMQAAAYMLFYEKCANTKPSST